jgi:hypothetical protein
MSFGGSESQSTYLPVDATAEEVKQALNQLATLRKVEVTRANTTYFTGGYDYAGFEWTIVMENDIGDQPALDLDTTLVTTTRDLIVATVYDGDNSLATDNTKMSAAYPGEAPKNYNSIIVDKDLRSYIINNLVPATTYYVAVSAINSYGVGKSTIPADPSTTLPQLAPSAPTSVSIDVHPGSATSLDVTYDASVSNGGSDIFPRVEI